MARNISSPDDAPLFSIDCSSITVTGSTSLIWAPWICVPVTTISGSVTGAEAVTSAVPG
ncbi:hypothetical protein [Sphingopyxis sp.]|uniref:hypothetical protein n=1 Tax=Sphingopyxis sp. TaxID=1908224 RepID=UPI0025E47CB5|nr:hypothetical protein [Sphingopyxis sp.]